MIISYHLASDGVNDRLWRVEYWHARFLDRHQQQALDNPKFGFNSAQAGNPVDFNNTISGRGSIEPVTTWEIDVDNQYMDKCIDITAMIWFTSQWEWRPATRWTQATKAGELMHWGIYLLVVSNSLYHGMIGWLTTAMFLGWPITTNQCR